MNRVLELEKTLELELIAIHGKQDGGEVFQSIRNLLWAHRCEVLDEIRQFCLGRRA